MQYVFMQYVRVCGQHDRWREPVCPEGTIDFEQVAVRLPHISLADMHITLMGEK